MEYQEVKNKFRKILSHPNVAKASKVANKVIDVASKVSQAKMSGGVAIASAGVSVVDTVVKTLGIVPPSDVRMFIEENKLQSYMTTLPISMLRAGSFKVLGTETLAFDTETDELLIGKKLEDGNIVAFRLSKILGSEKRVEGEILYTDKDIALNLSREAFWKSVGHAVDLFYDRDTYRPAVLKMKLRGASKYIGNNNPKEFAEEILKCQSRGISYASLLHGPPGTGKSTFVHALVQEMGINFMAIRPETSWAISGQRGEEIVRSLVPDLILLDDIDRSPSNFSTIMSMLESIRHEHQNMIIISTCNELSKENTALLRPGRLGSIKNFPVPTTEEKNELLRFYMEEYQVDPSKYDFNPLIEEMKHAMFSHDHVRAVAEKAVVFELERLTQYVIDLNTQLELMNGMVATPTL
jgi:hypothetical protein